jgi:hypothetical protein
MRRRLACRSGAQLRESIHDLALAHPLDLLRLSNRSRLAYSWHHLRPTVEVGLFFLGFLCVNNNSMAGRPSKLTKEVVEKASGYVRETKADGLYPGDLPTIEGLAIHLDVTRSSLYEWEKQDTALGHQFSDILDRVKTHQAYKLIGKGLNGSYNATIVKMMLSKHGYVEESKVEQNVNGNVTFVNDVPRPARHDPGQSS